MGAIATFSYPSWSARYPELAACVAPDMAAQYFVEAGLYLDNTGNSPVSDVGQQGALLNMIVAHLASISGAGAGGQSSGLVGRISSATQGSVSVSTELNTPVGAAFWAQSKYGLSFWQATARFRTFRYVPPRCHAGYGGFRRW